LTRIAIQFTIYLWKRKSILCLAILGLRQF
jgi:hypothetical protein